MSKIKKISLMRKNCTLNGRWLEEIGSNPHSKGEDFSWSLKDFFEIKIFKNPRIKEIDNKILNIKSRVIIIYIKLF